jgi:hypothetical protein
MISWVSCILPDGNFKPILLSNIYDVKRLYGDGMADRKSEKRLNQKSMNATLLNLWLKRKTLLSFFSIKKQKWARPLRLLNI